MKLTRPQVRFHKRTLIVCLKSVNPEQSLQARTLLSQPTSKLLKFNHCSTEKSLRVNAFSCPSNVLLRQKDDLFCQPVRFDKGFAVHPEGVKGGADEDKH
jgi:hypothetical protein